MSHVRRPGRSCSCCTADGPADLAPRRAVAQLAVLRMVPFARSLTPRGRRGRPRRRPAALPRARLERLRPHRPGGRRALGPGRTGRAVPGVTRSRWWGTRWADAPRSTSPTTPPCASSSGSRRGSRPTTRSTTSPAGACSSRTATHDRVTDPAASAAFADRARAAGAQVTYLSVGETSHAMLRRAGLWHDITTQFALRALSETTAREAGRRRGDQSRRTGSCRRAHSRRLM